LENEFRTTTTDSEQTMTEHYENDDDAAVAEKNAEMRARLEEELNGVRVPEGYHVNASGVYDENAREYITRCPFWVQGLSRKSDGTEWSIRVAGWGCDGLLRTAKIDFSDLHGRPSAMLAKLDKEGFQMVPGLGKELVGYVSAFRNHPQYVEIERTGWHEIREGEFVFILPERVIGGDGTVEYDLDRLKNSELARAMRPSGTLADWVKHVALPAQGNPVVMFTLMLSFSGPLRFLVESEFLGVHWRAASSSGKSITLGVGASVWGCGAPCGGDRPVYMTTWLKTQNSLEWLCATRSDMLTACDELGEFQGDLASAIYMLSSGQGKLRMRSDATVRSSYKFRATVISTGEKSIEDVILEDGRSKAKAGQFIRMLNVECPQVFIDTKGKDPAEFVDKLRDDSGQYYCTAGVSFLEHLFGVAEGKDIPAVDTAQLRDRWDEVTAALRVPGLHDQHRRVIRRLGVVALAGLLAVDFGILPYTREEVVEAVAVVRDMWLRGVCVLSDAERAVRDLKEFIEDNLERRIQDYQKDAAIVRDRVAFRHRLDGRDLFLFTRVGFRRACGAANKDEVCRYLADKGLLHMNSAPRYQSRFSPIQDIMTGDDGNGRVFSRGSKVSFYAVEAKILSYEFEAKRPAPAAQPPEQTPPVKDGRRAW